MGFFRILFYTLMILFFYNYYIGLPPINYTFKVKVIKELAKKHSGSQNGITSLRKDLSTYYPGYVLNENDIGWLPCHTGNLHGAVSVLYSSMTELLVLYRTQIESTGNSGRHFMNVSVSVLQGQMEYITNVGELRPPSTISSGENHVFRLGTSSVVKLSQGATMLIYCRGIVPLTFGYWVSESLFVHHDPLLAIATIWNFLKASVMSKASLWKGAQELFKALWKLSSEGIQQLWNSVHYGITHLPEVLADFISYIHEMIRQLTATLYGLL